MRRIDAVLLFCFLLAACGPENDLPGVEFIPAAPTGTVTTAVPETTDGAVASRNYSTFTSFQYELTGSCLNAGLSAAGLRRLDDESVLFNVTMLYEVAAEQGGCEAFPPDASGGEYCLKRTALSERTLTGEEMTELEALFSRLQTIEHEEDPIQCEEPCASETLRWDEIELPAGGCSGTPYIPWDQRSALVELLSRFAQTSTAAEPPPDQPQYCRTHNVLSSFVWDLDIGANGEFWLAGNGVAARRDRESDAWQLYTIADGLPSPDVRSIAAGADGTAWATFWQSPAVAYFDGRMWNDMSGMELLADKFVVDIAIDQDGIIWFLTGNGLIRLDKEIDSWRSYTTDEVGLGTGAAKLLVATDGSLWLVASDHAAHVSLLGEEIAAVKSYRAGDCPVCGNNDVSYDEMAIAADGTVWLTAGFSQLVTLDPARDSWQLADCCDTLISTFLPVENGIWIGADRGGLRFQASGSSNTRMIKVVNGLASNDVRVLLLEGDDQLWVGTGEGLSQCGLNQ